ncbi:MAG: hypothetical protein H0U84_06930 [Thermoleophilaceae bacterium]|nr:hypothetical protein [Thermoleophilaceae bacterium]
MKLRTNRFQRIDRATQRPRHMVGRVTLTLLRPFFRYSLLRDAYVLRGIGRHHGPVLKLRPKRDPHRVREFPS